MFDSNNEILHFLFSFNGRTSRSDYWLKFGIPLTLFGLMTLALSVFTDNESLLTLLELFALWPTFAVSVRRCHDRGRSGWFVLLSFVPLVNIWYAIDIAFFPGVVGPNEYGPDPLAG